MRTTKPVIDARRDAPRDRNVPEGEAIIVSHTYTTIEGLTFTAKRQWLKSPSGWLVKCPACGCHVRALYEAQGQLGNRVGLWCGHCQSKADEKEDKQCYRKPTKKGKAA